MSGAKSKFGAPEPSEDVDVAKLRKLGQRCEDALNNQVLFKEPKQLDPHTVLVNPYNRNGAPPNVQYVHQGILKGLKDKGFDRTRPMVGICVKYESEAGKRKLLEHNARFSKGNSLLPPIDPTKAIYGSLAGSHLNIALRIISGGGNSPIGDLRGLCEGDESLTDVVHNGHRWWILPESTDKATQLDLSLWRNQDQNDNQGTNEIEILQTVVTTALELGEAAKTTTMGDLTAKALKRNPAKISPRVIGTLAKYFVQYLETNDQHFVKELVDFHSHKINPKELFVSNAFYETLTGEAALKTTPCTRHYLLLTQYTNEKVRAQAQGASVSAFLEPSAIVNGLVKKPELLKQVELKLRKIRDDYLKILDETLGESQARLELASYCDLVIRCLMGKPWPESLKPGKLTPGKFSNDKVRAIGIEWAKHLDLKYPEMDFARKADLLPEKGKDDEDDSQVNLTGVRELKRSHSDDAPPAPGHFKLGAHVTVIRRMSWEFEIPGNKKFRKDLVEGTEGVIEGFTDSDEKKVLLKVSLEVSKGRHQEVTRPVFPRNLQLSNDYKLTEAGKSVEAASSSGPSGTSKESKKSKKPDVPQFLLQTSESSQVKEEKGWQKLLADEDILNRSFWLKSRVGLMLQGLQESLPTYTDKDLIICHRQNKMGLWKDELWTKRAFEPNELILAPLVSQIKDTRLTNQANMVLGLPRHGRGAHPENGGLALDGRGKTRLAKEGVLDENEYKGVLYWLVTRASNASEANMALENVSAEQHMTLYMPFKKQKFKVDWEQKDVPTIPLIFNKKAIKKETKLFVFVPENKKEAQQ